MVGAAMVKSALGTATVSNRAVFWLSFVIRGFLRFQICADCYRPISRPGPREKIYVTGFPLSTGKSVLSLHLFIRQTFYQEKPPSSPGKPGGEGRRFCGGLPDATVFL